MSQSAPAHCPSLLRFFHSAAATAVGNTRWLRVKGTWTVAPSLYAILVGAPGMGKTPPLTAAYAPIRLHDMRRRRDFCRDMARYKEAVGEKGPRPVLQETLLDDFTLEALARAHADNPRGVTIVNDEVFNLFTAGQRYNAAPLVTQLLSAWSGSPLKYNRVSQDVPLVIPHPCIGIVGTTQTALFSRFLASGDCRDNGFLDRMLLAYPTEQRYTPWMTAEPGSEKAEAAQRQYNAVIERLFTLEPLPGGDAQVLEFTPQAATLFMERHNEMVAQLSASDPDGVDTRMLKIDNHVARLALVVQCLTWASGMGTLDAVEYRSLSAAYSLSRYYENCYRRLLARTSPQPVTGPQLREQARQERAQAFLDLVGRRFTRADATVAGEMLGMNYRAVSRLLEALLLQGRITACAHGVYRSEG